MSICFLVATRKLPIKAILINALKGAFLRVSEERLNGIQEDSGSIPLISSKKNPRFLNLGFFLDALNISFMRLLLCLLLSNYRQHLFRFPIKRECPNYLQQPHHFHRWLAENVLQTYIRDFHLYVQIRVL